ncbi:MAG: SUF system NifU family Fe-S cluster assembly protein [Gemmatimonadetes bacterium]|nr:SUF system NifU family Fe-S cluster assembly protein [Gemmatimonadota bacterium]NIO30650.1 SUF system NifU family Fe-S cluster assembly protein [Gemmatimonadota bacterium]
MSDLRELYQQVIIDHSRNPRNYKELEHPSHSAEGYNPLCGDQITVYLVVEGDRVTDVSFKGSGCAISKASASLMTAAVKGKTVAEAEELFARFREMVTSEHDTEVDEEALGKLTVLSGVREFPVRVKCATLAWHTLHSALEGKGEPVTTE